MDQEETAKLKAEVNKLRAQNKALKAHKKYGIVWEEERIPEQVVLDCQKKLPVLKEIKSKAIITDNDKPVNLLLEGDNYHALQVLNYTHKGKIDVIYIDPPFNTGAKDWKYNNNYVDKNDEWRHSKWLNFMYNRLLLAKNLLSRRGVFICAIDENEHAPLGMLLEEIFVNYKIVCVSIVHNPRGVQGDNFSYCHEYAYFAYPDNGQKYIGLRPRPNPSLRNLRDNGGESLREDARNCFYPFMIKKGKITGVGEMGGEDYHPPAQTIALKDGTYEVWPIDGAGIERKWRFARKSVPGIIEMLRVKGNEEEYQIHILKDEDRYKTVWIDKKYDANEYGTKLLARIIKKKFPYPKSLYNVKECLDAVAKDNKRAIILDYFAGSGTTAHAVLEMNCADNGNRTFIMCTNNENDICREVTYPRINNVIKGYSYKGKEKNVLFEKKLTVSIIKNNEALKRDLEQTKLNHKDSYDKIESKIEGDLIRIYGTRNVADKKAGLGGNLRCYKTVFVDVGSVHVVSDKKKVELTHEAGTLIAIKEHALESVEKNEWWQMFQGKQKTVAIYSREDQSELANMFERLPEKAVVYLFGWGKNTLTGADFGCPDIKIKDIPQPILEVYKEINRL